VTVWEMLPVLSAKLVLLDVKFAVTMSGAPTTRLETVIWACPLPSRATPGLVVTGPLGPGYVSVTVPVGWTPLVPETVMVNVTGWPKPDGFRDDVTVTVVGSAVTV